MLSVFYVTYLMYAPNIGMNIFRKMNMNFGLAPTCAVLIFCAARYGGLANRILQSGPVITLGEASYSIYLVHQVAFLIVARLVVEGRHGLGFDIMILFLTIGAIFVISLISYSFYEAPARKWLRAQWAVGTRSLD